MTKPTGMFWMQKPGALYNKMVHEGNAIAANPLDSHACFNFFVTAEHMPEWLYPGDQNKKKREDLKKEPLLRICSQIANGGKHFTTDDERHNSIASTAVSEMVWINPRKPASSPRAVEFVINLNPDEAAALGFTTMNVRELVRRILDFWEPLAKGPIF